jgi:hypothetical protein
MNLKAFRKSSAMYGNDKGTFITNFHSGLRPVYEKAIELSGSKNLFIQDKAFDIWGDRIPELNSLHCSTDEDRRDFWAIYCSLHVIIPEKFSLIPI